MVPEATRTSLRGKLLVATPLLRHPTFARTVVVVLEHNDDGALGVVVNRPSDTAVTDVLPDVATLVSDPPVVFDGGPVSPSTALALGVVRTAPPADWRSVVPPLVVVDLDEEAAALAPRLDGLRVFAGYAGWGPAQVEGEIDEGSWYVVDAVAGDALARRPDLVWSAVLRRQPWPLSAVAVCPVDPSLN